MRVLILGATGMLGRALLGQSRSGGIAAIGAARKNADLIVDVRDAESIEQCIVASQPSIVINAAATVSIDLCETDPCDAYLTNARPAAIIAQLSQRYGFYFVQISTDQFYTGDSKNKHAEDHMVCLVNEYARSKFAAECFALTDKKSLVVRTNIVGFAGSQEKQTFVDWALQSLLEKRQITLFDDFFVSSIDVTNFSKILFDLLVLKVTGILNVASAEIFSKKDFVNSLAAKLGLSLAHTRTGSVKDLQGTLRAESLGLDVGRAERLVKYKFPSLDQVIDQLALEYRSMKEESIAV